MFNLCNSEKGLAYMIGVSVLNKPLTRHESSWIRKWSDLDCSLRTGSFVSLSVVRPWEGFQAQGRLPLVASNIQITFKKINSL